MWLWADFAVDAEFLDNPVSVIVAGTTAVYGGLRGINFYWEGRLMNPLAMRSSGLGVFWVPLIILPFFMLLPGTSAATAGDLSATAHTVVANYYHEAEGGSTGGERGQAFIQSIDGVISNDNAVLAWDTALVDGSHNTATTTDFAGLAYAFETQFDTVTVHMGNQFPDGGNWSAEPTLYIFRGADLFGSHVADYPPSIYNATGQSFPEDGALSNGSGWQPITGVTPTYPGTFSDGGGSGGTAEVTPITFELSGVDPADRTGFAWAVGGVPGNGGQSGNPANIHFLSITELEATGTTLPSNAPGELSRIAPNNIVCNTYNSVEQGPGGRTGALIQVTDRGWQGGLYHGASGFDTWNGPGGQNVPTDTDFAGLTYGQPEQLDFLVVQLGAQFGDGGAWTSEPSVFVLKNDIDTNNTRPESDGNWLDVTAGAQRISPNTFGPVNDTSDNYKRTVVYDMRGVPVADRTAYGWAVGGVAGNGSAYFITVDELAAYTSLVPPEAPEVVIPTFAPVVPPAALMGFRPTGVGDENTGSITTQFSSLGRLVDGNPSTHDTTAAKGPGIDFVGARFVEPLDGVVAIEIDAQTFGDGGWFQSNPIIQVTSDPVAMTMGLGYNNSTDGIWTTVPSATNYPTDATASSWGSVVSGATYLWSFDSQDDVTAIRILGHGGGVNATWDPDGGWLGAQDVRVYSEPPETPEVTIPDVDPIVPPAALMGFRPTGVGNENTGSITSQFNSLARLVDGDPSTIDTTAAKGPGDDFVGASFDEPLDGVVAIELDAQLHVDGGWFQSTPIIQVTSADSAALTLGYNSNTDGIWTTVVSATNYPTNATAGWWGSVVSGATYLWTFDAQDDVTAIRILGHGGGVNATWDPDGGWISAQDIRVYSIPEPSSCVLGLFALLGLLGMRRRI